MAAAGATANVHHPNRRSSFSHMQTNIPRGIPDRQLVCEFAAHLAYLLNSTLDVEIKNKGTIYRIAKEDDAALNSQILNLEPGKILIMIKQTLQGHKYISLTGTNLIAERISPSQAVDFYFSQVLERRLRLARDNHLHKGHEVFLALCKRGAAPGWENAILARSNAVSGEEPQDFSSVSSRLAGMDFSIADSNPAKKTREAYGPLYLSAGKICEVPEEISVWHAIECAPRKARRLQKGPAFDGFVSLVIKAVETANNHYGTLVSLGLSPKEWQDLPVNTAKEASAFLSAVSDKQAAREAGGPIAHPLAIWKEVWKRRTVPGYDSAEQFWESELGRAIRHLGGAYGPAAEPEPNNPEEQYIESNEQYLKRLEFLQENSVITTFDAWIFAKLHEGATLAELAETERVKRELGGRASTKLRQHVNDVILRVEEFDRNHPDIL